VPGLPEGGDCPPRGPQPSIRYVRGVAKCLTRAARFGGAAREGLNAVPHVVVARPVRQAVEPRSGRQGRGVGRALEDVALPHGVVVVDGRRAAARLGGSGPSATR